MNQQQLIGTAFEYAEIKNISARMLNDLDKLTSLMVTYKRSEAEIKQLSDIKLLLTEYNLTYTSYTLEKLTSF